MNFIIIPPAFSQKSGFLITDDGKIHYQTYGSGSPFLIINGGPGLDSEGFSPLAELLSDKYLTILFDQRGTGKSALKKIDNTTITMKRMAQDIESLRAHLNIKDWIVLGHSFGGWMAEYYASRYPERIKGMILSSSGGIDLEVLNYVSANINIRLSEAEKESLKYWLEKIRQGDTGYDAKYKKGECLAPAYLYNKKFVPQVAERLAHTNLQINKLVFRNLHEINFDCKETLRNFSKPVLIIQGRQDIVGDGTAFRAHSILRNSTVVFLNECGHYGWLDQKEQYIQEIDKFLASVNK
ncbi:alpha/beta fold hydrolase [Desulfospira joergensenii]|uniref:alpha/beta fold hydrolase n=1 Tax=Desulfospira joergensenii TaxID=53329 RepID=UPI0024467B11|nr:alpha/beta hydrolase [Desulfospira joergensenii]